MLRSSARHLLRRINSPRNSRLHSNAKNARQIGQSRKDALRWQYSGNSRTNRLPTHKNRWLPKSWPFRRREETRQYRLRTTHEPIDSASRRKYILEIFTQTTAVSNYFLYVDRNQHLGLIHMRQPLWYRHYNVWPLKSIKRSSLPFISHPHKCSICSIGYCCSAKDRLRILEMLNMLSISSMKSGSKWNHTIIQPISYVCHIFGFISGRFINLSRTFERFSVEQIKSTPEIREKIIAAARSARKSASYPAELNNDIVYSKDQGLMLEDYRLLSGLVKHDNCLQLSAGQVVVAERTLITDEEKHLWMDSQSHSSSASSSDSQEADCGLGYPTSFITQFKVWALFLSSGVMCSKNSQNIGFITKELQGSPTTYAITTKLVPNAWPRLYGWRSVVPIATQRRIPARYSGLDVLLANVLDAVRPFRSA